jgi:pimeloyl-ACP methyl ester carboxylesterase
MAQAKVNGIQIEYETFGDVSGRPLLLIIGFSGQMIWWDDELCKDLAGRGHYVIRYDNRDAGLSKKCEETGSWDFKKSFGKIMKGEKISTPYTLGISRAGSK